MALPPPAPHHLIQLSSNAGPTSSITHDRAQRCRLSSSRSTPTCSLGGPGMIVPWHKGDVDAAFTTCGEGYG
eukprot:51938-Eustigmatos_ZCMA.PRE.1